MRIPKSLLILNYKVLNIIPFFIWLMLNPIVNGYLGIKIFSQDGTDLRIFVPALIIWNIVILFKLYLDSPLATYQYIKLTKHKDKTINEMIDKSVNSVLCALQGQNVFKFKFNDIPIECTRIKDCVGEDEVIITKFNGRKKKENDVDVLLSFYLKKQVKETIELSGISEQLIEAW